MPGNEDAEKIYLIVQDQLILSGMGGPVAINQLAIHAAMDLHEIADRQDCFAKVVMLGRHFIELDRQARI